MSLETNNDDDRERVARKNQQKNYFVESDAVV